MTRLIEKTERSVNSEISVQGEERAEDRHHADQEREAGGDEAAEDEDEEQHRDRDGDRLGPGQVALDRASTPRGRPDPGPMPTA